MKTTILPSTNSINRSSLPALLLICFAFAPQLRATCQDACLTNSNTVQGDDALISLTTGIDNTAMGFNALHSNATGNFNTANGSAALYSNTTGDSNTAIGYSALYQNTTGGENTAIGLNALTNNTTANNNTATGFDALAINTTGQSNTANGSDALYSNTTGSYNTANGNNALSNNTTGSFNTAVGSEALNDNMTGISNTAVGQGALNQNTTGSDNTANGVDALFLNTTGFANTATGAYALQSNTTGDDNTANGVGTLQNNTTGSGNIALGDSAGINLTTGNNNIDIGNRGVAGDSKTIRIGAAGTQRKTFIAGISGATVASGVVVIVGSNGQLGTVVSSERFKNDVKPMGNASEAILSLKPITFRYKHELDPEGIPQFGLVAEDVEKVNPALVARDDQGKVYTVRYEAVNAMLLNEFLKARHQIDAQQKQIDALTVGLQKVSAQLELSKSAPQITATNQ